MHLPRYLCIWPSRYLAMQLSSRSHYPLSLLFYHVLPIYSSIHPSTYPWICVSIHQSIYLSISQSLCHLSVNPPIHRSMYKHCQATHLYILYLVYLSRQSIYFIYYPDYWLISSVYLSVCLPVSYLSTCKAINQKSMLSVCFMLLCLSIYDSIYLLMISV